MREGAASGVAQFCRSVRLPHFISPRRTRVCPKGARYYSPGQASLGASVALGQRTELPPKACRAETELPMTGVFRALVRLSRPVGAPDNSIGYLTQGDAPRGLGACPGLYYVAPLGLRAPKTLETNADSASLRRDRSGFRWLVCHENGHSVSCSNNSVLAGGLDHQAIRRDRNRDRRFLLDGEPHGIGGLRVRCFCTVVRALPTSRNK